MFTEPTDAAVKVHWIGPDGSVWTDKAGPGPALFEWTSYELFAESRMGKPIITEHRDPRLLSRLASPSGHPEMVSGAISFRGQVGMTRLDIRCDGVLRLRVELEVFPTKLDYASDYDAVLAEVNTASRALALEYLRATYRQGAEERISRPTDLEFATLLRHHLDEIARAMAWVARHPDRRLVREPQLTRVERMRRPSRLTKNAIRQRRGSGPLVLVPGLGAVRARLPAMRAFETLDTPEHRWLRNAVLGITRRVTELIASVELERANAAAQGRSTLRLRAEAAELAAVRAQLGRLLRTEPLADAVGAVPQGFSSLTLLRMPGYREAVKGLLALGNGLSLTHGSIETSVKDLEVLYEFWCFLRLASLLYDSVGGKPDVSELFEQSATGLRTRFAHGTELEITLDAGTKYRLAYNRSFAGFTGTQRPDILLVIEQEGWPAMYVVLDAKYRIDASEKYIKQFQLAGPPEDAINQLHRYRDAIVLEYASPTRSRPVVKGAALFPLDPETSASWFSSPLGESLARYGIGALPFLPYNDAAVREWVGDLLAETSRDLSWPGPPFAAADETLHRQSLGRARTLIVKCTQPQLAAWKVTDTLDLALPSPHSAVVQRVLAAIEDASAGTTRLTHHAAVIGVSPSGAGATRLLVQHWEAINRTLTGGGLPSLGTTTDLAISRAQRIEELGLASVAEWDLVEMLRRSALDITLVIASTPDGQLATSVVVGSGVDSVTVHYERAAGFAVIHAGSTAYLPSVRDVLKALLV